MKVNIETKTNGSGLWSRAARNVKVISLRWDGDEDYCGTYGHLLARFRRRDWSVPKHGLIYMDPLWIKTFREGLVAMGASKNAASKVDYTEQGMQEAYEVSMNAPLSMLKKLFNLA